MNKFLERLNAGEILVADGATGSNLQKMGLKPGRPPEDLIRQRPLVQSEDPVGRVQDKFDQTGDGQAARLFAGGVAAHAVGHHHPVAALLVTLRDGVLGQVGPHGLQEPAELADEEVVLVVGPHLPGVRLASQVHPDSG